MDKLLATHNDLDILIKFILTKLYSFIQDHLGSVGFILRKWISSEALALTQLDMHDDSLGIILLDEKECSRTLGTKCHIKIDQ